MQEIAQPLGTYPNYVLTPKYEILFQIDKSKDLTRDTQSQLVLPRHLHIQNLSLSIFIPKSIHHPHNPIYCFVFTSI